MDNSEVQVSNKILDNFKLTNFHFEIINKIGSTLVLLGWLGIAVSIIRFLGNIFSSDSLTIVLGFAILIISCFILKVQIDAGIAGKSITDSKRESKERNLN
ncbi:MAG: hypothetical protein JW737_03705 [Acidobacteria bacterium]|nr:hypothetical protein [Acidobacteriota bacterium]